MLEGEAELEEQATALLGAQDDTVCTYPEGYKARQPLYSCLTCIKEPDSAAICYGCSMHCHDGHDTVELYTKRNYRCDCGNSKFGDFKCNLYEEKAPLNENNVYNDNFHGKFCTCKHEYGRSGEAEEDMFQCVICEDWFHLKHCGANVEEPRWKAVSDAEAAMVCKDCSCKNSFLTVFEAEGNETICMKDREFPAVDTSLVLAGNWRKRICPCSFCEDFYSAKHVNYLLDPEDDVTVYQENNMKAKDNELDDNQLVDVLVKEAGRDVAIKMIRGYHDLKTQMIAFMDNKLKSGPHVFTADDVQEMFSQIKRPRLDDDAVDVTEGSH